MQRRERKMANNLKKLEQTIGYQFTAKSLLEQAMTHSSYANEKHLGKLGCNERLEFLGDAVLELISSDFLYKKFSSNQKASLLRSVPAWSVRRVLPTAQGNLVFRNLSFLEEARR